MAVLFFVISPHFAFRIKSFPVIEIAVLALRPVDHSHVVGCQWKAVENIDLPPPGAVLVGGDRGGPQVVGQDPVQGAVYAHRDAPAARAVVLARRLHAAIIFQFVDPAHIIGGHPVDYALDQVSVPGIDIAGGNQILGP